MCWSFFFKYYFISVSQIQDVSDPVSNVFLFLSFFVLFMKHPHSINLEPLVLPLGLLPPPQLRLPDFIFWAFRSGREGWGMHACTRAHTRCGAQDLASQHTYLMRPTNQCQDVATCQTRGGERSSGRFNGGKVYKYSRLERFEIERGLGHIFLLKILCWIQLIVSNCVILIILLYFSLWRNQ